MASNSTSDSNPGLQHDTAHHAVIDTGEGLKRLMGDSVLYARMLARFSSDYRGWVAKLRSAIAAPDPQLAHRMAHNLKGASGMIGAHALHWQACALERALRTNSGIQMEEITVLEPLLDALLHALDGMVKVEDGVCTEG
jgi:two-component system sensor histidine kinase/response regulator